jgi:hypothetical protein
MFRFFAFVLLALVVSSPLCRAQAQVAGDWQGTLTAQGEVYHIVLHIVAARDGSLSATVDNIDQGEIGVPASPVTLKDSKLSVTVDTFRGVYTGTVNQDATEIDGTWSAEQTYELNFKRVPVPPAPPTLPAPPVPAAPPAPPAPPAV